MTEKPDPWAGMSREERLAAMPPFKKRPKKPEPEPKVTEPKVIVSLGIYGARPFHRGRGED